MTTILDIPGSNPPNPFSTPIQAFLTTPPASAHQTAAHLFTTITTSSNPAHALWELWDAFFTAVVTSPTSQAPLLTLLDALHAHPPTQPKNTHARSNAEQSLHSYTQATGTLHWPALPRFSAQWRDVHDILEAWRDWDGVHVGTDNSSITLNSSSSGGEYYLRFCVFSAALLKETTRGKKGEVHPVWVFYACHDVLERETAAAPQPRQLKAHRMAPEQLWALDVRVAATWVRDGGRALWETDYEELRLYWAAALDDQTDLWPREAGLTREQWQLWGERLRALSAKGNLDEGTRMVVTEAAGVVGGLLEGNST